MIILEIVVAVGLIYAGTRIVLKILSDRRELRLLREQRAARLESASTAEQLAHELLLDKEMAKEVVKHLEDGLKKEPDKDAIGQLGGGQKKETPDP